MSMRISSGTLYARTLVPTQNSIDNIYSSDVIGNKTDTNAGDSIVSLIKAQTKDTTELETHAHTYEKWFESANTPVGETRVASRVGNGNGKFRIDAGNNDWGAWVIILGSENTPVIAGNTYFDLHMLQIENTERTTTYFIQIAFGETGATALSTNTYSDVIYTPQTNQIDSGPIEFRSGRQLAGTKVWARCKCSGQNTAWIDFFFGLHEYIE